MQLKSKDISKIVAKKLGEREDVVHTIQDCLFKRLSKKIRNPKGALKLTILGLGTFYFRNMKTKNMLEALLSRKEKVHNYDQKFEEHLKHILSLYEQYKQAQYEKKVEYFGKESHDAYLLAQEQKKLQIAEKNKREYSTKLRRS